MIQLDVTGCRSRTRASKGSLFLVLATWLAISGVLGAQEAAPANPEEATSGEEIDLFSVLENPADTGCLPPNTQEKILIIVGCFSIVVACFFLVVRLAERSYIQKDRSALLGRHWGISWTLLIVTGGLAALTYLITGCVNPEMYVWLGFCGVVWLVHLVYLIIVVRSD